MFGYCRISKIRIMRRSCFAEKRSSGLIWRKSTFAYKSKSSRYLGLKFIRGSKRIQNESRIDFAELHHRSRSPNRRLVQIAKVIFDVDLCKLSRRRETFDGMIGALRTRCFIVVSISAKCRREILCWGDAKKCTAFSFLEIQCENVENELFL